MKYRWLRILGIAVVRAGIAGMIATLVGVASGWSTPRQFSDGLFWAGAILMGIGLLAVLGGYSMRSNPGITPAESVGEKKLSEYTKLWAADMTKDWQGLLFLVFSGGLLMAVSILIDSLASAAP